jgi:hypothetical protein
LGLNLDAAKASRQYQSFDAAETLSRFMVDGSPDRTLFENTIVPLISESGRRVRIYGEMVALLWTDDNRAAALQLEEMWNDLQKRYSFSLLCGYPINSLGKDIGGPLQLICSNHSGLVHDASVPLPESYDRLCTLIALGH